MIIFSTTLSLFLFLSLFFFFFFNDPPTTEIYTLSLHDALPIFRRPVDLQHRHRPIGMAGIEPAVSARHRRDRGDARAERAADSSRKAATVRHSRRVDTLGIHAHAVRQDRQQPRYEAQVVGRAAVAVVERPEMARARGRGGEGY